MDSNDYESRVVVFDGSLTPVRLSGGDHELSPEERRAYPFSLSVNELFGGEGSANRALSRSQLRITGVGSRGSKHFHHLRHDQAGIEMRYPVKVTSQAPPSVLSEMDLEKPPSA